MTFNKRRPGIRRAIALGSAAAAAVGILAGGAPFARAASGPPQITEYPVPTGNAGINGITSGPDGDVWFMEAGARKLGALTPAGAFSEYPIASQFLPRGLAAGPDGNLWSTVLNTASLLKITTSGTIAGDYTTHFLSDVPEGITPGPDGALWFAYNGTDAIGRITTSGSISKYPLPTPGAMPAFLAAGPDGNMWFTEGAVDQIGEITPSGVITEYPLPISDSDLDGITAGPDGNVWFTEYQANEIGKIAPSGVVTEYPLPTQNAGPAGITLGSDGNLWFTENDANQIGEITPSGVVTEYPVPTANAGLDGITTDANGNVYFSEYTANQIGEVVLVPGPPRPQNLTIPSPATQPMLSWDSAPGATSYNIYRDGVDIGSSSTNSFTDTTAAVGTYDYDVTAVNSQGESLPSQPVTVLVGTAPGITSADNTSTGMGVPFSFTVTTSGTPTAALSETGNLPDGVTFTDNGDGTGTISGVAPLGSVGTYPITITASNGLAPDATQDFTLTVNTSTAPPAVTSASNDTETVGVPFSFTVTTYGYPAPSLSIVRRNGLPKDITFTDNGDGTATIASSGPAAADAGSYAFIVNASNGILPQANQTFTLTITNAPVLKGIPATKTVGVGDALTMNITAKGYPVARITETGTLPDGLTFTDNGDGTASISGTPQPGSAGAYPITITADNATGVTSQTFTLKVDDGPEITSADTAAATSGSPFSFTVTTTGYPAPTITKTGTLPKGLTWQRSTGTISGTPAAGDAGTYPITFTAKNSSGTVTQEFTLTVS
jgi:streptogramin lyase